jgi:hypothetical protein
MTEHRPFRAYTDQMLSIVDELRASERTKQEAVVGSPAFLQAAVEAERLARLAFRWASMQLALAQRTAAARDRGDIPDDTRLSSLKARPLDRILAGWREAELRFEISKPGSREAAQAADEIEALREEFREAQESRSSEARELASLVHSRRRWATTDVAASVAPQGQGEAPMDSASKAWDAVVGEDDSGRR